MKCHCTNEEGDSFCLMHPRCNECGAMQEDFAKVMRMEVRSMETEIAAVVSVLGVADVPAAIDEIRRLKRVDDAAKQLVSTMGAAL